MTLRYAQRIARGPEDYSEIECQDALGTLEAYGVNRRQLFRLCNWLRHVCEP